MNRRGFLKSFGALAAAAVAGPSLAKLAPSDVERLVAAMRTGVVEDQVFYFTAPITINFDNLIIRRCTFLFNCPYLMEAPITINAKNLYMEYCHIDSGPKRSNYGIKIQPQDEDMGTTIKSAVDTAFNGKGASLYFPSGTYKL